MKKTLVTAHFDLKTGKTTIEDEWLGKREVETDLDMVKDQLKLLMHYRRDGRKPSALLLEDIKVYKYIIKHDAPDWAAEQYMSMAQQMRDELKTISLRKMDVARRLGWRIF